MTRSTSTALAVTTEKRLSSYASVALASVGVLSAAQVAEAQIVTTTNAGQTVVDNGTIDLFVGPGFAINGGPQLLVSSRRNSNSSGFVFSATQAAGTKNLNALASHSGAYVVAENFAQGVLINSMAGVFAKSRAIGSSHVSTDSDHKSGYFAGKTGYLGFSFTDPNNPAQTDYGWAEITESRFQNMLTLDNAAYNDTGAPIATGQVPEPGSLALLAGGAGCLAAWRLRSRRHPQIVAVNDADSVLTP